jgi:hypothetical protein
MARPLKEGLAYFPLDTDFFGDDKLFDIQNEFGPLGEVIYLRILCLIYKNGYYYEFSSMDKLCALLIRSIGNRWTRGKRSVEQVILQLAECNLLSSELVQSGVLTSVGVQKRYLKVTERRRINTDKYWLLGDSKNQESGEALESAPKIEVSATETGVIVTETPIIDSNNDTKEKKSKVNNTIYIARGAKEKEGKDSSFDIDSLYEAAVSNSYQRKESI